MTEVRETEYYVREVEEIRRVIPHAITKALHQIHVPFSTRRCFANVRGVKGVLLRRGGCLVVRRYLTLLLVLILVLLLLLYLLYLDTSLTLTPTWRMCKSTRTRRTVHDCPASVSALL